MARHPFIEVRPDLANQWHIQVNPDGCKTLLVRPDLGYERTIEMLEDVLQDRFDNHPICSGIALTAIGVPTGSTRAAIIAHLLREMAAECAEAAHLDIVKPRDPQHRCADKQPC